MQKSESCVSVMERNSASEARFPASLSEVTRGSQAGSSRALTGERRPRRERYLVAYMRGGEIKYAICAVLRSAFDDERIVVVMDPQFEELAKEITAAVTASIEKRLESHFRDSEERVKEHIDKLETRIEGRLAIHFEGVKDQVQRGAEGYGATLESIDRRLDRFEKDWNKNFRLHSSVLKNHADRIDAIEKRG